MNITPGNRNLLLIGGAVTAITLVCGCLFILIVMLSVNHSPQNQRIAQQPTVAAVTPLSPLATATPQPTATSTVAGGGSGNTAACTVRTDWSLYSVVAGDTLGSIAVRSNTTFDTLASANCLSNPNAIQVGQQLRVPAIPVPATAVPAAGPSGNNSFSSLERLSFAADSTRLVKADVSLNAGSLQEYVINLQSGQTLITDISGREANNLTVSIIGADGSVLVNTPGPLVLVPATIPSSQDYVISIHNSGVATSATLQVIVPVRIAFAAGASSATKSGALYGGNRSGNRMIVDYILNAGAGQTLTVAVSSPNNDVVLTVYGAQDRQFYLRAQSNGTIRLPGTQDYVITAEANGSATAYELTVTVTN